MLEKLIIESLKVHELKTLQDNLCYKYCGYRSTTNCIDCEIYKIIKNLAYYKNLEEQGKLLVLPCKPGDTAYEIKDDCEFPGDCHQSRMCKSCEYRNLYVDKITATLKFIIENIDKFGKTVFLTEQEAKEALEGTK